LMRIRDAALADELLKAVVMDPRRGLGRDANVAHKTEPVEQRPHVVRLRRGRGISQPSEGRRLEHRIGDEQRIELGELHRRKQMSPHCSQKSNGSLPILVLFRAFFSGCSWPVAGSTGGARMLAISSASIGGLSLEIFLIAR